MIELFIALLVLCFGGMLRLAYSTAEASDEWVSFWLIGRQRGSRWINYRVNDSLLDGIYGYPSLQHFLVSRLPRRLWGLAGRVSNLSYDLAVGVCVYFATALIADELQLHATLAGLSLPCAAMLLFLTTPALLPIQARMATIKGRSLGMLWTTLYFIGLGLLITQQQWWGLAIALIAGELAILTSQFALQVMVFFSLFLGIYCASWTPIAVLSAVLALGWSLPALATRQVLLFYTNHKIWYLRNYQKGTTAAGRNRIRDYLTLPVVFFTDFRRFITLATGRLSLVIAMNSAPLAFVVTAAYVLGWPAAVFADPSPAVDFLAGILLASGCWFVLTSLPVLVSFGQAERYFEYSAFAFCPLFVVSLAQLAPSTQAGLFWLTLIGQVTMVQVNLSIKKSDDLLRPQAVVPPSLHELIGWLDAHIESGRFLTMPPKLSFLISPSLARSADSPHRLYYRFIQRPGEIGFRYFEHDMGGLGPTSDGWGESRDVIRRTPRELADDYGVTHLIVAKRYEESLQRNWEPIETSRRPSVVFENDSFLIYEVCPAHERRSAIAA